MSTAVILVAAGSGTRLGSPLPKAFVSVGGKPLLQRALETVAGWSRCDSVVLVVPAGYEAPARALAADVSGLQ
ncbi:MAG: NTP transferase domain-containing protein, partial [Microbacteriaceae bacterium]|nr:NTP transferase domain-containing protein [Microbacteriaceae bacterium]